MGRKLYLFVIEFWWHIEHMKIENIAVLGYQKRKRWEQKYVNKFNENIYSQAFTAPIDPKPNNGEAE